ncbi:MAG: helix-turn-helix domain-containing protein [Lachnospiraceae bacterium]
MSNVKSRTISNVFYKARCEASKHNEQLKSREGAADIMSIDRGRLYRIESGITNPHPEEVHLMADLYRAPELENYFCTNMCTLGCNVPKAEDISDLYRIAFRAVSVFQKVNDTEKKLLEIAEDGIIDENEKPVMNQIINTLNELEGIAQSMKIWAKKNL